MQADIQDLRTLLEDREERITQLTISQEEQKNKATENGARPRNGARPKSRK